MTPDRPAPDSESLRDPRFDAAWRALSREEPPAALDASILAAAHRAVGAGPQRAEVREATRPERWWWPLAAAASIGAVALGVLQVLGPEQADVATAERAVVSDAPVQSSPAAPPPSELPKASAPIAPAAEVRQRDTRADTAPAPPVARPAPRQAPVAKPMPAAAPEPAPAAPPASAQDAAAPREAMGKAAVGGIAPAPAGDPAPAAAPAGTPAPASAAAPAAARAPAAVPATALRAEAQRKTTAPLPIDEWLARIRKLRAEGRAEELAREIAAFRAAYPGEEKRLQDELARPVVPRSPG